MGITKTEGFSIETTELASQLKALGHPARLSIIQYLVKRNECICSDLVDVLPLAQSTVSRHLNELKNANLIKGSVDANNLCYCINDDSLKLIQKFIGDILTSQEPKTICC